eukprot:CAMPEP_0184701888 /NCGR_PEP_ID=MMETSP0313-20130426/22033_1 /TAXON_ID=2792 /ORGANISM="Porphyridium aerugineum, Strain SAG 1380-2" /LENGTH=56 /DNA_ID=CAMNT_0027162145 /DNA_START=29 /DNA_END=195 /DNA_ORIENTATION=-
MIDLFLPSVACCAVALGILTPSLQGTVGNTNASTDDKRDAVSSEGSGSAKDVESMS